MHPRDGSLRQAPADVVSPRARRRMVRSGRRRRAHHGRRTRVPDPAPHCKNGGRRVSATAPIMPRPATIAALRRQIDRLDDRMLALLTRRARLVQAIGAAKTRTRASVYAPAREKHVLGRLVAANRGPLDDAHVRAIFGEVISASRSLEQRLRVAYLGPQATYAHLAAMAQFGSAVEFTPSATIAEVFHDVENVRADLGVVP